MADRQAVVLIHGIGEQRPMDTLRGFVTTVWTEDDAVRHPHAAKGLGSKPDAISDSFELRRLTTSKNRDGVYTDFFEFYWAHMVQGTRLGHVWSWARALLVRWPWQIPRALAGVWLLLVGALALVAAFAVNAALPGESRFLALAPWVSAGISIGLVPLLELVLRQVVGDAARYLDPAPANIQIRQRIRSAGVSLLANLHERGYERIVVVGHSGGFGPPRLETGAAFRLLRELDFDVGVAMAFEAGSWGRSDTVTIYLIDPYSRRVHEWAGDADGLDDAFESLWQAYLDGDGPRQLALGR